MAIGGDGDGGGDDDGGGDADGDGGGDGGGGGGGGAKRLLCVNRAHRRRKREQKIQVTAVLSADRYVRFFAPPMSYVHNTEHSPPPTLS